MRALDADGDAQLDFEPMLEASPTRERNVCSAAECPDTKCSRQLPGPQREPLLQLRGQMAYVSLEQEAHPATISRQVHVIEVPGVRTRCVWVTISYLAALPSVAYVLADPIQVNHV